MVFKCCVCGATSSEARLFSFPKNEQCRKKWIEFAEIAEDKIPSTWKICHRHFTDDQMKEIPELTSNDENYKLEKHTRLRLIPNAVPSLDFEGSSSIGTGKIFLQKQYCLQCKTRDKQVHFKFPENLERRNEWLKRCGYTPDFFNGDKYWYLCSRHFSSSAMVKKGSASRNRLRSNAVPTLFMTDTSNESSTQKMTAFNETTVDYSLLPTKILPAINHDIVFVTTSARNKENLQDYDGLIQRCFSLSESNLSQFMQYANSIEELRLKLIAPVEEYRILKSWLHVAYDDIIQSKFEHIDLIRLYEVLLNNNFVQEFYDYVNDRKTLQLKFIQMINESKNLETKLNAVKEDVTSLVTKYVNDEETLRMKFIDTIDECKRLKSRLDSAYEEIILSDLEYDIVSKRYQKLLEENTVKEFLDCAKDLETLQLKFSTTSNKCKCSTESCLDKTNAAIASLQSELQEIRKKLKRKRPKSEKFKEERDSLDFLLEKLCRLLLKIPNDVEINQKNQPVDESIQSSANESVVDMADDDDEFVFVRVDAPEFVEEKCVSFEEIDEPDLVIQDQVSSEHINEPNSLSEPSKCSKSPAKSNKSFSKEPPKLKSSSKQSVLCEKCGDSFKVKNNGQRPLNCPTCDGRPKVSYARCDICGREYTQKLTLKYHIQRVHEGKKLKSSSKQSVLCEKCGESFKVKNNGQRPLNCPTCEGRPKVPYARCDICGRDYTQKLTLKYHIQRVHEGKKFYQCAICGKQFNVKCNLTQHELTHGSEKPYKCSTCNRCFKNPSNLKRHVRIVHEKLTPYCCAHCDKKCGVKSELLYHIHTNHFSGSLKQFKCIVCDKSFAFKHDLTRHQSLHSSCKA